MERFKGIKGPWTIGQTQAREGIFMTLNGSGKNIIMFRFDKSSSDQECMANMTLMASAPELLEALQDLVGHFAAFTPSEIQAKNNAINAINKALTP